MFYNNLYYSGKGEFIAELLCADGAQTEHHSLEIFVTHQAPKFWLSRECPYNRPYEAGRLFM